MKKYLTIVLILLSLISIIKVHSYFTNNPEYAIETIKKEYTGWVSDIYYDRYFFVKISNISTHEYEKDIRFTNDFLCSIDLGDKIHEIPNQNLVEIFKVNGGVITITYIFIPNDMREDSRWPEDWKNKWIESSDLNNSPCEVADLYSKYRKK